jgi:hypothetical protein
MKKFFALSLVVLALAVFTVPVFAQEVQAPVVEPVVSVVVQEEAPLDLTGLLQEAGQFVLGSVVIAAAATFVVNTGKDAGLVSDSQSVTWVSTINFILIVGVFCLKLFNPNFDLGVIERVADAIVRQGPGFILPLMPLLIKFSKWIHEAVKGAKWIGTSYSLATASSAKKK